MLFAAEEEACCNEKLYQKKSLEILTGVVPVQIEVPVVIKHHDYAKQFRVDLIAGDGLVCEFKAVQKLHPEHESQLLEYMLFSGATHGKLINFGSQSVQGKLITPDSRNSPRHLFGHDALAGLRRTFSNVSQQADGTRTGLGCLSRLQTWYDSMIHFLGGPQIVMQNIRFDSDSKSPTHQLAHLISPSTAFKITALRSAKDRTYYEQSLQKFLANSNLNLIQWVNFNQQSIHFKTLSP